MNKGKRVILGKQGFKDRTRNFNFITSAGRVVTGNQIPWPAFTGGPPSTAKTVEAWKFAGDNSKGFSPINVPNQPVDCLEQGIRPVYGPATLGQSNTRVYGCGTVHRNLYF